MMGLMALLKKKKKEETQDLSLLSTNEHTMRRQSFYLYYLCIVIWGIINRFTEPQFFHCPNTVAD